MLKALLHLPAQWWQQLTAPRHPKADSTALPSLNLPAYMGRWYEQARYEHSFELDMDRVYTDYMLSGPNRILVINVGHNADGTEHRAKGIATAAEQDGAELRVSFVPPYNWFTAAYRVLYVDPDYTEALVSGKGDNYLWLLTREPRPGYAVLRRLIKEAKRRGFDLRRLRHTKQSQEAA